MKRVGVQFLLSVAAGLIIGVGGTVFLSCDDRVVGSVLFSIGLTVILHYELNLFTGKIGYALTGKPGYLLHCALVWLGNLVGTSLVGFGMRLTRAGQPLADKAGRICDVKLHDSVPSIFILAVLCGLLMYIAVDSFKNVPHAIGKYITVFLCVSAFILSGFEHCIANMYYFSVAHAWSLHAVLYLAVMTLGNAVGGMLLPAVQKIRAKHA